MLRKLESITPAFLKELDRKILLSRPGLWATKIHYVLFLSVIGFGLVYLYGMVKQINLTSVPEPVSSFALALIPAAIFFLFWAYRISFFQVEKGFGQTENSSSVRNMMVYALVIGLLALAPVMYYQLIQFKLKTVVSEQELTEDINILNLGESIFVTDSYEYDNVYRREHTRYPEISYLGYNRYTYYNNQEVWSNDLIEEKLKEYDTNTEKLQLISQYIEIFNTYSPTPITLSASEILNNYYAKSWGQTQTKYHDAKYKVSENLTTLQKVHDEKRGLFSDKQDLAIYMFLLTFLWMALQAFLKTNWKLFGGAVLTAIGTGITIGVVSAMADYANPGISISFLFLLVTGFFAFFLAQGFRKRHTHRTKAWKSIALSVAAVATPIMPLIVASIFDNYLRKDEATNLMYLGILVSVLAWGLLYGPQFTKLAAQPKEN